MHPQIPINQEFPISSGANSLRKSAFTKSQLVIEPLPPARSSDQLPSREQKEVKVYKTRVPRQVEARMRAADPDSLPPPVEETPAKSRDRSVYNPTSAYLRSPYRPPPSRTAVLDTLVAAHALDKSASRPDHSVIATSLKSMSAMAAAGHPLLGKSVSDASVMFPGHTREPAEAILPKLTRKKKVRKQIPTVKYVRRKLASALPSDDPLNEALHSLGETTPPVTETYKWAEVVEMQEVEEEYPISEAEVNQASDPIPLPTDPQMTSMLHEASQLLPVQPSPVAELNSAPLASEGLLSALKRADGITAEMNRRCADVNATASLTRESALDLRQSRRQSCAKRQKLTRSGKALQVKEARLRAGLAPAQWSDSDGFDSGWEDSSCSEPDWMVDDDVMVPDIHWTQPRKKKPLPMTPLEVGGWVIYSQIWGFFYNV